MLSEQEEICSRLMAATRSEDGSWRGSQQYLMEVLETEDLIPSHDDRRGFDICNEWPDEFTEYPSTHEALIAWAVLGKPKILQIEELTRQYMVDVEKITKFRFRNGKIIWAGLPFEPYGTSLWIIRDGLKFQADGHVVVGDNKYKTSGCDIYSLGSRIWSLHSEGVMISYDSVLVDNKWEIS